MFCSTSFFKLVLVLVFVAKLVGCTYSSRIGLGSRLLAKEEKAWVSDNGTFAFGFTPTPTDSPNQFQLAIWFAQLPGDTTTVWSAYLYVSPFLPFYTILWILFVYLLLYVCVRLNNYVIYTIVIIVKIIIFIVRII